MRKDIDPPQVTDVGLAIVREEVEGEQVWNSYIVNMKEVEIEGVIIVSKGYGEIENEPKKTSVLRHYLEVLPAKSFGRLEPVIEDVFGMFNEYWVTFFEGGKMFDRRFIFVPESISEKNFTEVPLLGKKGVLIL